MTWLKAQSAPKPQPYGRIHCFSCHKDVPSKRHLRQHMGHDVHYVDPITGKIND